MTDGKSYGMGFLVYMVGCWSFGSIVGVVLYHWFGFTPKETIGSVILVAIAFTMSGLYSAAQKNEI